MSKLKIWIDSFRLRTLPLSLSGVILGSFLAFSKNNFNINTCILALSTTVFLQILSNLANDLGDSLKGTDNDDRKGPQRAMQTGLISTKEMKIMICIFTALSMLSGSLLIIYSFHSLNSTNGVYMILLGALAIIAALKYTLGKGAYGYYAMGDVFVFIFFGLASVIGTYFLHTSEIPIIMFLPAISIGMLSIGVLNMNNIRDIENDRICHKKTIPVIIGEKRAKFYHYIIIFTAISSSFLYMIIEANTINIKNYLFILSFIPILIHLYEVSKSKKEELDIQLKKLSLSTLLFSILFGISAIL